MNKSNIEWTNYTWNPVTGCHHGCNYCYARRLAEGRLKGRFGYENGFEPTFHPDRLFQPGSVKKPSMIFVCSMGDLFGDWVPSEWITDVLRIIRRNPQHTFQILTKNPKRIANFHNIPKNVWLGTSIDGLGNSVDRTMIINDLPQLDNIKFISFEPLLADVANIINIYDLCKLDWIIIGAQTGPNAKQPRLDWIKNLIYDCNQVGIPVFVKDNVDIGDRPQFFPI